MSRVDLCQLLIIHHFPDAPHKLTSDEEAIFESRTDSGFISGGNLITSGEITSEEISDSRIDFPDNTDSKSDNRETNDEYMRVDSGIVCLSDSFSSLSLKHPNLNDLSSGKIKDPITPVDSNEAIKSTEEIPWQIYYEQDEDGDTHLHISIVQGFSDATFALIRLAPLPSLLDTRNDVAETPLHLSVITGQWRTTRALIVAGARPCPRDLNGDSPLHLAARTGDLRCCKAITDPVQHKERESLRLKYPVQAYPECNLDQWNYEGQTCVHVAAIFGNLDVLRHLVWCGADINAREGKNGYTALYYAIERQDQQMLRFLIEECSGKIDFDVRNYGGQSPLQLGFPIEPSFVQILLSRGVEAQFSSEDEYSDDSEDDIAYDSPIVGAGFCINASA